MSLALLGGIRLDPSRKTALQRQLYESLRVAILERRIVRNTKLPSSRDLAEELGVSRNTVIAAFAQLTAEGYLEGRVGAGTYVSQKLPEELLTANPIAPSAKKRKTVARLSVQGRMIASTLAPSFSGDAPLRPFVPCLPSASEFPFQLWSKLISRRLKRPVRGWFNYGEAAGFRPLREAIAAHLGVTRAVRCSPEQVLIVSGTQQAVDLTARMLLDPGDAIWMENPCYLGSREALRAAGARITPLPIDEEGMSVAAGKKLAPSARLAYVTPSHQYPLGVTMSLARRLDLLEWAYHEDAWILEDDYDSEFRYESRPIAALQGLDEHDRVIYVGTFSKVLSPALRLGYLVAPPDLVDAFLRGKALLDRCSPLMEQIVLADFFNEGHFARHIRRMRRLYAERREILIEAIDQELRGYLTVNQAAAAGLHVTCWLPTGVDDTAVARAASLAGIETEAISVLSLGKSSRSGLVLGYAPFEEREIIAGVRRLAAALLGKSRKV
jgi:GntR family transcriptional regulator/MocR family aminotransferase